MKVVALNKIEKYFGDVKALRGLNMNVTEGEVYGFLGRNGAGKSTALQIIMGITRPTAGSFSLFGAPVTGEDPLLRQHIGYVAQEQHFYDWMTARRLGQFVSGFYPSWDDTEYHRLLTLLEVPVDRKTLGFSGGMTAKLALALALAHRPRLLLLDEPTAGMDAVARREFIDIVRDQSIRSQRTTLFSSHLIDEIELAADKVGIVDEGRMRYEGSLDELRSSVKRFVLAPEAVEQDIELPGAIPDGGQMLRDHISNGRREITIQFEPGYLLESSSGWQVEQPTLEDIFVAMVSKTVVL